jgi:ABC-2 type transport system ATP-binding protein
VTAEAGEGATATLAIELDRAADSGRVIEAVVAALVAAGAGVREVVPRADSLEQVFSELTGGAA